MRPSSCKVVARSKAVAARQIKRALPCGDLLPETVAASFVNLAAYEPAEFCRRSLPLPTDGPILVIGCGAGRDSHWLAAHGYKVVNLDLAPQLGLERFLRADMTAVPLRTGAFAAVVMSDVLEHTFDDVAALREARRLVAPAGTLVLNLPLGDDIGEHHVRVYTVATALRTLSAAGWQVADRRYRGLLPWLEVYVPGVRLALRCLDVVSATLSNRSVLLRTNRWVTFLSWHLLSRVPLTKFSKRHGVYLRCTGASAQDFTAVNLEWYDQQAAAMYGARVR